jgi:hypothetical protein
MGCLPAPRTERSLYERANGYNYDAVKIFMLAGSKQLVVVHYTEHCAPDPTSAMFWLKNPDPENWRDVQNVDHVLGKYIISDRPMTEEEWARATVQQGQHKGNVTSVLAAARRRSVWSYY